MDDSSITYAVESVSSDSKTISIFLSKFDYVDNNETTQETARVLTKLNIRTVKTGKT